MIPFYAPLQNKIAVPYSTLKDALPSAASTDSKRPAPQKSNAEMERAPAFAVFNSNKRKSELCFLIVSLLQRGDTRARTVKGTDSGAGSSLERL